MAMTYLTKLKPEPMGAHNLATAYGVNSLVMSEDGAAAYISVKDVPAGTPLTNTEYWKKHTDLTAVKQSAEAAAQKANAARAEMLEIARSLTDAVEKSGNPVQAELVGGLPFDRVATALSPIQSGSGDPSPSNIRAISGWTGAGLTRCGKNFVKSINSTGSTTLYAVSLYIDAELKPNTQYTLSFIATAGNSVYLNEQIALKSIYIDTTGSRQSITFTTKDTIDNQYETGKGFAILKNSIKQTTATVFTDVQLELGSTATTYEPYTGNTYSADFGQTVYGGTLDWQTGVLTVDKGYKAFDGTEAWGKASSDINSFYMSVNTLEKNNDYITSIKCSTFKTFSTHLYTFNDVGISGYNDSKNDYPGENWIYINNGVSTSITEFKEWLSAQYAAGTPVQIVYKLATPITIQLTPQEIKQLQGMNTLYGDGSISMTGRADKALALEARIAALEAAG